MVNICVCIVLLLLVSVYVYVWLIIGKWENIYMKIENDSKMY